MFIFVRCTSYRTLEHPPPLITCTNVTRRRGGGSCRTYATPSHSQLERTISIYLNGRFGVEMANFLARRQIDNPFGIYAWMSRTSRILPIIPFSLSSHHCCFVFRQSFCLLKTRDRTMIACRGCYTYSACHQSRTIIHQMN